MDSYGIQVSVKPGTAEPPLINVRGDTPAEFDTNLDHVISLGDRIQELRTILDPPPTMGEAVDLLKRELGAEVIYETPATPAQAAQWVPPVHPPQPPGGYQSGYCLRPGGCGLATTCSTCGMPCNPLPKSVKNGQYHIHECPSGDRAHKGRWCNDPK